MERSISWASRMLIGLTSTLSDGAAVWMAANRLVPEPKAASRKMAARVTVGATSLSNSTLLTYVAHLLAVAATVLGSFHRSNPGCQYVVGGCFARVFAGSDSILRGDLLQVASANRGYRGKTPLTVKTD